MFNRNAADITSIFLGSGEPRIDTACIHSGLPRDIEAQNQETHAHADVDPYSPYYSPLEVRKQMSIVYQVTKPEEMDASRPVVQVWRGPCLLCCQTSYFD